MIGNAKNAEIRGAEFALLALLRAAPGTVKHLAVYFPRLSPAKVTTALRRLAAYGLATQDEYGMHHCTVAGLDYLDRNGIVTIITNEDGLITAPRSGKVNSQEENR